MSVARGKNMFVYRDNFELGPQFQKQHELGADVFDRVHELGPSKLLAD